MDQSIPHHNRYQDETLGTCFFSFGIPKMIVVDADDFFLGFSNQTLQENLLFLVHAVKRVSHK